MIYEYILLGGTFLGALMGYIKGFLKQISSLIGLLLGIGIAILFSSQAHDFFVDKGILSPSSSLWLSFILTVGIVLFVVLFLTKLIKNLLKKLGLDFTNKIAGMLLGALKYFIIIMIPYCFLESIQVITKDNSTSNLLVTIKIFKDIVFKHLI